MHRIGTCIDLVIEYDEHAGIEVMALLPVTVNARIIRTCTQHFYRNAYLLQSQ